MNNNQLLIRTLDFKEFEVLNFKSTFFGTKKYERKLISFNTLLHILKSYDKRVEDRVIVHHYNKFESDDDIVAYTKTTTDETYILNIKEQYIRTFYKNKYYKIIHPKCFIKIIVKNDKVGSMYIYPYKDFKALETEVFDNPFPNIYTNNKTCMGSADRSLLDSKTQTILSIIETAYTDANTRFKGKKLKDTTRAFRYLTKNPFPYDKLTSSKKTLGSIIEEIK